MPASPFDALFSGFSETGIFDNALLQNITLKFLINLAEETICRYLNPTPAILGDGLFPEKRRYDGDGPGCERGSRRSFWTKPSAIEQPC
jgi:hypothetical protein